MKKKEFDCVELMRNIRDQHWKKYKKDPDLRKKRLQEIRKKFKFAVQENLQPSG